jgi:nucleolar protein 15
MQYKFAKILIFKISSFAEYFTQFGKVSKIRISRNKKTGKSKHYGFLEFQNPGVAKVVADAMDGYMFFGQKLQSRVMNRNEVHPEIFKGANRVFKKVPWKKLEVERHNKEVDEEVAAKRTKTAEKRDKARKDRIKDAGIDYEFPSSGKSAALTKKAAPAATKGKKKAAVAEKKAPAAVEKKEAAAPVKKAPVKKAPAKKTKEVEKQPGSPPKRVTRSRATAVVPEEAPAAKKSKTAAGVKGKTAKK